MRISPFSRPGLALGTLGLLLTFPYLVSPATPLVPRSWGLLSQRWPAGRLRVFTPWVSPLSSSSLPEALGPAAVPTGQTEVPSLRDEASSPASDEQATVDANNTAPRLIDDPSGHALDAFHHALEQVQKGTTGSRVRILYYGDSVVAADLVSSTLRRRFQQRFGDGGHGFLLPINAWVGYAHNDVIRYATNGWKVSRVVGPYASDHLYGLGGVSFTADVPGTMARVRTVTNGPIGTRVSRFVLSYVVQPKGGDLLVRLDQNAALQQTTRAEATAVKTIVVDVPDGPHSLEVQSAGHGTIRLLGIDLERQTPGVIVDALGIVGGRLRFLDVIDDDVWAQELSRREPQLVIFHYGANESEDGFAYPMDQYEQTARAVLQQVRNAVPGASCLLVGPLDRVDKRADGYVTREIVPALNDVQRRLAAELSCGFFDSFAAMGGRGSMGTWVRRGLGSSDLVHPTALGAEQIGAWLFHALLEGYGRHRSQ